MILPAPGYHLGWLFSSWQRHHRSFSMLFSHINQQAMPARTVTNRPLCMHEVGAWPRTCCIQKFAIVIPAVSLRRCLINQNSIKLNTLGEIYGNNHNSSFKGDRFLRNELQCFASLLLKDSKVARLSAAVFVTTAIESKPSALSAAMSFSIRASRISLSSNFTRSGLCPLLSKGTISDSAESAFS